MERLALERRYTLLNGEPDRSSPDTWQYELGDRSRDNLTAIVGDPAIGDTHNINRETLTAPEPDVRVGVRPVFPFSTTPYFDSAWRLFQPQSLFLLLAGGIVLLASRAATMPLRRAVTIGVLLLVGTLACAVPISPTLVRMGDSTQVAENRRNFEGYAAVDAIRFDAHLSHAMLGRLDSLFGRSDASPAQAQIALSRMATAAFVLFAIAIGFLERWSPVVVRYLGLALLAPSALKYFGWREFGYLSLNVAAFPLIVRGAADGGPRLEAGSALAGLGAALHGWGLVSLLGACLAGAAAPAPLLERARRVLRIGAWGTAAYVGWLPLYIIVLKMPILLGHVDVIPWRPWFEDQVLFGRINPAVFSATGARDLALTAWVAGTPLFIVAASLWRHCTSDVRTALTYAVPSVLLTILVWNTQGLAEDMDVVFGMFPALYALVWVCATPGPHSPRRGSARLQPPGVLADRPGSAVHLDARAGILTSVARQRIGTPRQFLDRSAVSSIAQLAR